MGISRFTRNLLVAFGLGALMFALFVVGAHVAAHPRDAGLTPRKMGATPHHLNDVIGEQQFQGINPDHLILYLPPGFTRLDRPIPGSH